MKDVTFTSKIRRDKEYTEKEKLEIVDEILSDICYTKRIGNESLDKFTYREDRPDRPMKFSVGEKYDFPWATIEITKITEKFYFFKYIEISRPELFKKSIKIGKEYRVDRPTYSPFSGFRYEMERFTVWSHTKKQYDFFTIYACDNSEWKEQIFNENIERRNNYNFYMDRGKMKTLWTTTR